MTNLHSKELQRLLQTGASPEERRKQLHKLLNAGRKPVAAPSKRWVSPPVEIYEGELERAKRAIRDALLVHEPLAAVRRIEAILNRVQGVFDLGDAKLNRLYRSLPRLKEPEIPAERLTAQCTRIGAEPRSAEAVKLVLALLEMTSAEVRPELNVAARGSIDVCWGGTARLRWLVHNPTAPWPGLHVRAFWAPQSGGRLEQRSFWTVNTLLEHFEQLHPATTVSAAEK